MTSQLFPHLFSPLRIGNVTLAKRIVPSGHDTVLVQQGKVANDDCIPAESDDDRQNSAGCQGVRRLCPETAAPDSTASRSSRVTAIYRRSSSIPAPTSAWTSTAGRRRIAGGASLDANGLLDYVSVRGSSSLSGAAHIAAPMTESAAYTAPMAAAVKSVVRVPVIVAGRINQPHE
nr:hypothetical protein [Rhodococcus koreensis]